MRRGIGETHHFRTIRPTGGLIFSDVELSTKAKPNGKFRPKAKMPEIQIYIENIEESLRKMNEIYEKLKKLPR